MTLHEPATERALLALANEVRQGQEMQPKDGLNWFRRLLGKLTWLLFLGPLAAYLRHFPAGSAPQPWQVLLFCLVLMYAARRITHRLEELSSATMDFPVLVNLPVAGSTAVRWIRSRLFWEKTAGTLLLCFCIAGCLRGFALEAAWELAGTTLLLASLVFATALLVRDDWVRHSLLPALWMVIAVLALGLLAMTLFTERKDFLQGGMPEWLVVGISTACWLLPPAWVMPGYEEGLGVWLAGVWLIWGCINWLFFPVTLAIIFDDDEDFISTVDDESEPDESDDADANDSLLEDEEVAEESEPPLELLFPLPEPLKLDQKRWVERWIVRGLSPHEQHLAGVMTAPYISWSQQTHRALKLVPLMLACAWVLARFFRSSELLEAVTTWSFVLGLLVLVIHLLPVSNAIPRAMDWWGLGGQALPFFSALPIRARELLRVSMRITWVRTIIFTAVTTPFVLLLSVILLSGPVRWELLWLVPACGLTWALSRPVFIWYRLQAMSRRRRGVRVWHALASLIIAALIGGWVVLSGVGLMTGFAMMNAQTPAAWWKELLFSAGCALGSGLCARGILELFLWRLRRQHFDWISDATRTS